MNIFYTSKCPIKCAENLDDKRLVNMCRETTQLLSAALHLHGIPAPCKLTHQHHPCVKWAAKSAGNFMWLCDHLKALCSEYTSRYHKHHAYEQHIPYFYEVMIELPSEDFITPPNCAANAKYNISFKHIEDITIAYQKYLNWRWENTDTNPRYKGKSLR